MNGPARENDIWQPPSVTIHYAQTLDGRIATRDGQSQWISGEASMQLAHQLRASHEAVLVGVGTVTRDNPRLTVRLVPGRSPLRVVVDSSLRLPLTSNVLTDGAATTLVATTDQAPRERISRIRELGSEVLVVRQDASGRVDMPELLRQLGERGVSSMLVEGGHGVITTILQQRLANRMVVCIAPVVMGAGIDAVGELDIRRLSEALAFESSAFTPLGEDIIFDGQLERTPHSYDSIASTPDPQPEAHGDPSTRSVPSASGVRDPDASAVAVWFPRAGEVELRRERLRPVGPGDVRVRAVVSAVSHGTEMLVYRGQVPPELALDLPTLEGSFSFPIKYGYASVGRVEELGSDVRHLSRGDLVFVHHPHQSEYVVPASSPVPLPLGMEPESAVFLANVETAVNVMLDSGMRLGERVVIFGQGVVGLLLTQLARRAGAGLVAAVDPLSHRRDLALQLGADVALEPGDDLWDRISSLTDGVGADLALEASGRGAALDQAIRVLAFQGTVVVCSWYGSKPVNLALGGAFHRNRLRLISSQVSNIDPGLEPRWSRPRRLHTALDLISKLRLDPLITHRFPLRRAGDAYRLIDHHPEEVVQLLLTYGRDDV